MKKTILALTILSSFSVNAMPELSDAMKELFIKKGLPVPGSGVTIVEPSKNLAVNKALVEQKRDGYRHEYSPGATELLTIDEIIAPEYKRLQTLSKREKQSEDITKELTEITMAYQFKPVPNSVVKRVITYAPTGAYNNTPGENEGWMGITEFFDSSFATCSYEENNISLSGASSIVSSDQITYEINGKVTEYIALGDTTGYMYLVQWTDNTYRRKLRCATKIFSPEVKEKIMALANKIDLN